MRGIKAGADAKTSIHFITALGRKAVPRGGSHPQCFATPAEAVGSDGVFNQRCAAATAAVAFIPGRTARPHEVVIDLPTQKQVVFTLTAAN
jgi:hypothetical protein